MSKKGSKKSGKSETSGPALQPNPEPIKTKKKRLNFAINKKPKNSKKESYKSRIDYENVCRIEYWTGDRSDGTFIGHTEIRYCIIGKTRPDDYAVQKEKLVPLVKIIARSSQKYLMAYENSKQVSLETRNSVNVVNAAINSITKYSAALIDGSLDSKLDIDKHVLVQEAGEVLKFLEQAAIDSAQTSYSTRKLSLTNLVKTYKPTQPK